jgi:hypothetical protein
MFYGGVEDVGTSVANFFVIDKVVH